MMFLDQIYTLSLAKTSEREHTYLVGDMVPCSWGSILFKSFSQSMSHIDYAIGYFFDLLSPFLGCLRVAQNSLHYLGAVEGRAIIVQTSN